jgi:hypothetical protein
MSTETRTTRGIREIVTMHSRFVVMLGVAARRAHNRELIEKYCRPQENRIAAAPFLGTYLWTCCTLLKTKEINPSNFS